MAPGGGIFPRKFGPGKPYFGGGGGKFPGTPVNLDFSRVLTEHETCLKASNAIV